MIIRLLLSLLFLPVYTYAQVTLDADGPGGVPTYDLITNVLAPGYNPIEVPDCGHGLFGDHITEVYDNDLGDNAFQFFIHVNEDDDRCINFDRQRNEIKTYSQSPSNLLGIEGETVEYRWKFKLDIGFQGSSSFTHLHQLKSVNDANSHMPLITFTARGSSDRMELRYAEFGTQSTIYYADLNPFRGEWVDVVETITYANPGTYDVSITRLSDGVSIFQYSNSNINTWRVGASFIRPKWGIYRSLNNAADLRDEEVRYAGFSIKEINNNGGGNSDCPILVDVKAILQGGYNTTNSDMNTNLNGVLPINEPYTALSYPHVGGGGETTTTAIMQANDIVDWVVVELRNKANAANVVATRSALINKNGKIVDMDGVSAVAFDNVTEDHYYLAIRHRNHLAVMTDCTVALTARVGPPIISEAGFELNSDSAACGSNQNGRDCWLNSGLGGTLQITQGPLHEGCQAGKLPADGTRIAYQLLDVMPNTDYTFTFWYTIKTTPVGSLTITILDSHVTNPADIAAATITSQTYSDQSSNTIYVEETINFNTNTSTQIAIYITNTGAECRFDDFSLVEDGSTCEN